MPKFVCIASTVCLGNLWKPGEVFEGKECPNKYFSVLGSSAVEAMLEPRNSTERAVWSMRPSECANYIRTHFGKEVNPRDPDLAQKALRIVRNGTFQAPEMVDTRPSAKPEPKEDLLTKKQIESRIKRAFPDVKIPPSSAKTAETLKAFEAELKDNSMGDIL